MKLTTKIIKQLIREELSKVMDEAALNVSLDKKKEVLQQIIDALPSNISQAFDSGQLNYGAFEAVVGMLMDAPDSLDREAVGNKIEDGIGSNERFNDDARQIYYLLTSPQASAAFKMIKMAAIGDPMGHKRNYSARKQGATGFMSYADEVK
tara:strand:+ start:899 stop:1351 length:453 start_codon:yes stop_codon:yes gene_type:complete